MRGLTALKAHTTKDSQRLADSFFRGLVVNHRFAGQILTSDFLSYFQRLPLLVGNVCDHGASAAVGAGLLDTGPIFGLEYECLTKLLKMLAFDLHGYHNDNHSVLI